MWLDAQHYTQLKTQKQYFYKIHIQSMAFQRHDYTEHRKQAKAYLSLISDLTGNFEMKWNILSPLKFVGPLWVSFF